MVSKQVKQINVGSHQVCVHRAINNGGGSMQILKCYKDESEWFETTEEECLEHTEKAGFWKEGSVLKILEDKQNVWTPYAIYKKMEEGV